MIIPKPLAFLELTILSLTLSYPKHLGPTRWTGPLSRRSTILHSYASSILHFPLGATFQTVRLHLIALLLISMFQVLL